MAATKFLSFNKHLTEAVDLKEWLKDEVTTDEALPLRHIWHIWEQVQQEDRSRDSYSANTADLASFDTVQKFWRLWSCIPQPSELLNHKRMVRQEQNGRSHVVDALMIFREGVQPMWEDPVNASGGHLEYRLSYPHFKAAQIDEYWNNIVLALVGNTLESCKHITGVRLVDKLSLGRNACIRLEVWFSKIARGEMVDNVVKEVNKCMGSKLDGSAGQIPRCDVKFHSK